MRILIVEDRVGELREIAQRLEAQFHNAEIITAKSSPEVISVLEECRRKNIDIDVAILDIMLDSTGEFNTHLPYMIRDRFPHSLILHYTRYLEAQPVQKHAKVKFRAHDEIIQKGPGGIGALCDRIQQYWEHHLIGKVRQCFDVTSETKRVRRRSLSISSSARCDTLEVNTLLREVSDFYGRLSNAGKEEINNYFVFEREGNQWRGRPVR